MNMTSSQAFCVIAQCLGVSFIIILSMFHYYRVLISITLHAYHDIESDLIIYHSYDFLSNVFRYI